MALRSILLPGVKMPGGAKIMSCKTVEEVRLTKAKRAFSTRRVPFNAMKRLITGTVRPQPGDLVLARIDEIGKHTKLELTDGPRR